jgi:hypothetical protein
LLAIEFLQLKLSSPHQPSLLCRIYDAAKGILFCKALPINRAVHGVLILDVLRSYLQFIRRRWRKPATTTKNELLSDMVLERINFGPIRIHVIHEIKSSPSKIKREVWA